MGMLVVTALVTFFVQRQELWSIGKKAAVKMAGTAVVDVLAPGLHYEEKENGNHFLAKVEKILFPIADYTVQIQSYETDAESTLSYEMIPMSISRGRSRKPKVVTCGILWTRRCCICRMKKPGTSQESTASVCSTARK